MTGHNAIQHGDEQHDTGQQAEFAGEAAVILSLSEIHGSIRPLWGLRRKLGNCRHISGEIKTIHKDITKYCIRKKGNRLQLADC
jgi:hypothetical protein